MVPVRRSRLHILLTAVPPATPSALAAIGTLVAVVSLALLVDARPAAADPPRPTNHRSRVLSVEPPAEGVTVDIRGGDAFVQITVEPGHEVIVPDYGTADTERPYLHFQPDGTVRLNESSAAASANESRFGSADPGFDPDGDPRWRTVAEDGSHAWHDHRIHLMVPDDMAVVDHRGRIDLGGEDGTWEIPLEVDGVRTTVTGELIRVDPPSTWPWVLLVVMTASALLAGLVLAGSLARRLIGPVLVAAGATAAFVSATELTNAPAGSGASPLPLVLAIASTLGAAVATVAMPARGADGTEGSTVGDSRRRAVARGGASLSAATLMWWGVTRTAVFSNAILPSGLGSLDRISTSVALGVGAATAVVLMWRPALVDAP